MSLRVALTAVLVSVVFASALPARAQGGDAALAKGIAQVQEGYLDDAVTTLGEVVRRLSLAPNRKGDVAQAYLWLGIAYAQLDSEKLGQASFRAALTIDPRVSLAEGWPPRVARLFAAAKQEAAAPGQQVTARATSDEVAFKEVAAKIQAGVEGGDAAYFAKVADSEALLAASVRGLQVPPEQLALIRNSFNRNPFGSAIVEALKDGGTYRFLRLRQGPGGRPQALFRALHRGGEVNYHDYALRRDASGVAKVIDVYVFSSGEWTSETYRRGLVMALADTTSKAGLARLVGVESEFAKAVPELTRINTLAGQGHNAEALASWLALPASLQANKSMLLLRLVLAQRIGERPLEEAIAAFVRLFPNDPGVSLLLLDSYQKKKQYDLALQSLERVRRDVGGDAYLDFMRGSVLYNMKDFPAARAAAEQAIAAEPALANPYWILMDIALDEKNHAETARVLAAIEKATGRPVLDVETRAEFADFIRSDAYRKWMASRGK